jgi:hypothetical protein
MSTSFKSWTDEQTEQANTNLERMYRTLEELLTGRLVSEDSICRATVNNAVRTATGFTPLYLKCGRRHPRDKSISRAKDILHIAQAHMKTDADAQFRGLEISVGDRFLHSCAKRSSLFVE